jgi:myosin heavy subunit
LDRTVEALRIAGNNATKARADADSAEATAAALALTLQNVQTVLSETKAASQILHKEQLQVNATVAAVESKLLQKEAEIFKAQKDLNALRQANAVLENSNSKLVYEREELELKFRTCEHTLDELKREKVELAAIEKARKDRAEKVEQEWQKAQALLVEATSGQAAAKEIQALLEETICSLKKTNEELHLTLKEQQRLAREYKQRMSEALGKAEKEVQRLRISAEATSEEMARLKGEKLAADSQIQQLKSRLASTERSLKAFSAADASTETPASTNASPEFATTPTTTTTPNQLCFQLPPLSTAKKTSLATPAISEKENLGVEKGELCCMCYKQSIGIMKTCQCGSTTCRRKAHANCIKLSCMTPGPSVSHPGTPAPKLPIVLCDSVLTKIRSSISKEK